jgi:hypothetical protein
LWLHEEAYDLAPSSICSDVSAILFDEELDSALFAQVVKPNFYYTIQHLAEEIIESFRSVLRKNEHKLIKDSILAEAEVSKVEFRVAGAPEGAWGSSQTSLAEAASHIVQPEMPSGMAGMALRQVIASWIKKLNLIQNHASLCDHPPLWQGSVSNAYHLRPYACVVILPGLLRRPFADMHYDKPSLISRLGLILAHEVSHALDLSWLSDDVDTSSLFDAHCDQSHEEAMADLFAVLTGIEMLTKLGLARTPNEAARTLLPHWAQLWCGMHDGPPGSCTTHPIGNKRANGICSALGKIGISCD